MNTTVINPHPLLIWNAHGVLQQASLDTLVTVVRDLPRSDWAERSMTRHEQCDYICREILGITDHRLRDFIWRAANEE